MVLVLGLRLDLGHFPSKVNACPKLVGRVLGAGADPGLKAVSLQVTACIVMNPVVDCHHLTPGPQQHTCIVINPAVGYHFFLPGPQLPSQPLGVTAVVPVATYTAW